MDPEPGRGREVEEVGQLERNLFRAYPRDLVFLWQLSGKVLNGYSRIKNRIWTNSWFNYYLQKSFPSWLVILLLICYCCFFYHNRTQRRLQNTHPKPWSQRFKSAYSQLRWCNYISVVLLEFTKWWCRGCVYCIERHRSWKWLHCNWYIYKYAVQS